MNLNVLRTGKLYTSEEVIEDGAIVYDGRKILNIGRFTELDLPTEINITEFNSCSAAPGLIDLHVHGAAGADFMDATDEAFDAITKWHARGGTTAMLATTCAAPLPEIFHTAEKAGDWSEKQNNGSKILGIHAEGPFFNIDMRGCHLPEYIIGPDENAVTAFLRYREIIKHITIAPELEGAFKAIEMFSADDISVSAAHSNADQQTVERAIESGLGHVTHLFNAMSYYHKKGPLRISGLVETALTNDRLTVEVIADGLHVNQSRLKLTVSAKGEDNICLVTDAMRGAGMPDGLYTFGGQSGKNIIVSGSRAMMPEGTGFASSTVTMMECVRNMQRLTGISLAASLRMASRNPAKRLGIEKQKGSLLPGMDADIIVFDENMNIRKTIVEGRDIDLE